MFRLGTENSWFCSYGFDMNVDFCIWVLEVDGLRVPPFDHHAEGDGTLRAAGLDAESWHIWIKEVISVNDLSRYNVQRNSMQLMNDTWKAIQARGPLPADPRSDEYMQIMQDHLQQVTKAQQAQPDTFRPKHTLPPDVWHGDAAVGTRLDELWKQYGSISNTRHAWERNLLTGKEGNNLWQDLESYHTRLDSLLIHFVEYAQPVDYPIPPLSTIMTIVDGQLDYRNFLTRALQTAEALATSI